MIIRYSPHPIEFYTKTATLQRVGLPDETVSFGPGESPLLKDEPEAWNLAFLSFWYETESNHPDPSFTTRVRRTLQFLPRTGETDLAGLSPEETVRPLLRLPALQAVRALQALPRFKQLPLYQAYGEPWREVIQRRASALASAVDSSNEDIVGSNLTEAAEYLKRFTGDTA